MKIVKSGWANALIRQLNLLLTKYQKLLFVIELLGLLSEDIFYKNSHLASYIPLNLIISGS